METYVIKAYGINVSMVVFIGNLEGAQAIIGSSKMADDLKSTGFTSWQLYCVRD